MTVETQQRTLILGTAGHIDHGKTALVRAMTGIDCDRLPEEKDRGITIDIGFAQMDIDDVHLGIVDVPGHERFIKNMLAGASGINVAMLVIAADDSVMPQTREHLAILELLDVQHGLIALTKCDLSEDDWLDLVEDDIRELVKGTFLADAPIVRTSATTNAGIDDLRETLKQVCDQVNLSDSDDVFRIAVDRSFVVQGRGTVVTGTVWSGSVTAGEEVEWLPSGDRAKVRGAQSHGSDAETVRRGQRAALNLMAIHHSDIERGHELATPGFLEPSKLLTVHMNVLRDSPWPIKHRSRLRLYVGTQEILATVMLLEGTLVKPGESAFAQLVCVEPAVAAGRQPYVLRMESPLVTIGGGHVLQPVAKPISRRDSVAIERLQDLRSSDDLVRAAGAIRGFFADDWTDLTLARDANVSVDRARSLVGQLVERDAIVSLDLSPRRTVRLHRDVLNELESRVVKAVREHHAEAPLEVAMARTRLHRRFDYLDDKVLIDGVVNYLIESGTLSGGDDSVAMAEFKPKLSAAQIQIREKALEQFKATGFSPPSAKEFADSVGVSERDVQTIIDLCTGEGSLVHVGSGICVHAESEKALRDLVAALLADGGKTTSELRKALDTTRKYALPLFEYLDRVGFTKRVGDQRVLADRKA